MFNLELDRIAKEINENKSKCVLIQLPDGLKPRAQEVVEALDTEVFIWFGSCFGGCDIPLGMDALGVDLIVQFGHNRFHKEKW